jgi:signal transduction histidine kinase
VEEWDRLLSDLREEIILREDELELLHDIDMRLLKGQDELNSTFEFIADRMQELLKSDFTAILLRRGGHLEVAYSVEKVVVGQQLTTDASLVGETLRATWPVNIADVTAPPFAEKYVPVRGFTDPPLRSLLAAPIKVHEMVVGILVAESVNVSAFKPVHERIIAGIAGQAAIALQRAQLFEQDRLFAEVAELDELIFVGQESPNPVAGPGSQPAVHAALRRVLNMLQILEHVQTSVADIMFLRGTDQLEVVHSTNPAAVGITVPVDQSICGKAVREKRTIAVGNVDQESYYRRVQESSSVSEIAVPILLGDSEVVIGVLNVESEERDAFVGFSQVILENFADKVRTLLAFAKLTSDVTLTMELRNATDLLVAVGDQASNMIHRMNNTIGAMRLRIIELQEMVAAGELDQSDTVVNALATLKDLANQALQMPEEISRLLSEQDVNVSINQIIHRVLGTLRIPSNVSVELGLDPGLPHIPLYSFDLVVQNLAQNALESMPAGGLLAISTTSVIHQDSDTGYIEVTISDTGVGMSDEVLLRIFDLNFSTKHAPGENSNLGLWWIRNLVLRAQGNITVSSTEGTGSTFVVKLPITNGSRDTAKQPRIDE